MKINIQNQNNPCMPGEGLNEKRKFALPLHLVPTSAQASWSDQVTTSAVPLESFNKLLDAANQANPGFGSVLLVQAAPAQGSISSQAAFPAEGPLPSVHRIGPPTAVDEIAQLLRNTKADCGAPLEPEAVKILAELQEQSLAEFHRTRAALKKANSDVSLAAIDQAIHAHQRDIQASPTHHGYANQLVAELTVAGWAPVGYEGSLYVVDGDESLWVKITPESLERKVAELYDGQPNCERRADYTAIATHAMILASDAQYFDDAPVGLACPGGFYQVANGEISCETLTPAHKQRVRLGIVPVQMEVPMFSAFLHETFKSNRDGEEEQQVNLLQEINGSTMLGIMSKYHKAVMEYDPFGRAGKGTMADITSALVPQTFISAVSPFHWGDEYYLASLAGARLNVVGELSDSTPIPAAAFKTVTGGDLLTGRNPAGRPFSFKNQAAHLFMTNQLINTRDQSEAFFARWLLLEFPNSRLRSCLPLDPDLAKRIIAQELPGIVYWALEGALRLLRNGKFSSSMVHDRLMQKWRRSTNSLEEFIHESCDIGGPEFTFLRSKFYESYTLWCKDSGRKPFTKGNVKELLEHNVKLGITLGRINGGYETFQGVRLKPQAEPIDDDY